MKQGFSSDRTEKGTWHKIWDDGFLPTDVDTFAVSEESVPELTSLLKVGETDFFTGLSDVRRTTLSRTSFLEELRENAGGCLPSDVLTNRAHKLQALRWAVTGVLDDDYDTKAIGSQCKLLNEPVKFCPARSFRTRGPMTFETLKGAVKFFRRQFEKGSPYGLVMS